MKYKKKPIVIDAVKFELSNVNIKNDNDYCNYYHLNYDNEQDLFYIDTLEGKMFISDGDYIITGVKNERYACKPDIFELTYEKVENE
jgi:hypothetical protein